MDSEEFREYQRRNEYTTDGETAAPRKLVETNLYETGSTGTLFTKITRKWFIQRKEDYCDPTSTKSTFQNFLTKLAIEKYITPTEQMQII